MSRLVFACAPRVVALAIVATVGVSVRAAQKAGDKPMNNMRVVIRGELVDEACYSSDRSSVGTKNRDCAMARAENGDSFAILGSNGKLYTITGTLTKNHNAQLLQHAGHNVEVVGFLTDKMGKMSIAAETMKMTGR